MAAPGGEASPRAARGAGEGSDAGAAGGGDVGRGEGAGAGGPGAVGMKADDGQREREASRALARMVLPEHWGRGVDDPESARRRSAVKGAFLHAWGAYERLAFGKDEVHPVGGTGLDVLGSCPAPASLDCDQCK